nr:TMEM175 family protein [Streptomyces sp. NBC_00974]
MERETNRVQAFGDGVFAIAVTILVLESKVPEGRGGELWRGLREQWPHYAAYVVSFLAIGAVWVNHRTVFRRLRRVDRPLLLLNLLVVRVMSEIAYTTPLRSLSSRTS